jgi:transcriptional regulator with XRE-family HTH domain
MVHRAALRAFLRSRRALLAPADAGIVDTRRRRVPGLRREEVARLAGISPDHYSRLEQGRPVGVSVDVLLAIAEALQLNAADCRELFDLAEPTRLRRSAARPRVPFGVVELLALLPVPAMVVGRGLDVLASNSAARALLCEFDALQPVERNFARWVFLDPRARTRYREWSIVADDTAADLRDHVARYAGDDRLAKLVADLGANGAGFHASWRAASACRHAGTRVYDHPTVGRLSLRHEMLAVVGSDDLVVYVDVPLRGSPSERALQRLLFDSVQADTATTLVVGPEVGGSP